jgi:hypothetical protein
MKVNRKKLVEMISNEILVSLNSKIREIVAQEIDIERKRIRKQLFEEFRPLLKKKTVHPVTHLAPPSLPPRVKIDTGDRTINSILEDVKSDMELETPSFHLEPEGKSMFQPETTIKDVSKKMINEHRKTETGGIWKPEPGEAINFDPQRMDPTKIDWSSMVDALDERAAKSTGPL